MRKIPEKNWVLAGLRITGIVFFVLAFTTGIPEGGADNFAHFNIARWAFRYPHLFLDHWGKPVFTILSAPFAQLGFVAVRLLNSVLGLFVGWFVWKIGKRLNLENAWFAAVIAVFTPIYFVLMSSGMTEIIFSLILILSIYLFFSEKYYASATLISFLFLARTEGLAFELLFLIALLIKKQYRAIPLLATGFLVFSFIGMVYYYHDFWWLYNQRPYAKGGPSVYGSGDWYYFIVRIPEYSGWIIPVLFVAGTVVLALLWLKEKLSLTRIYFLPVLLVLGTFWGYFFIHTYLWWKGETSAGLLRVMAANAPLGGIIALYAVQSVSRFIKNRQVVSVSLGVISLLLIIFAGSFYKKLVSFDYAAEVLQRTTSWLIESGSLKQKLVIHNPYFSYSTEIDAWDSEVVQYGFSDNNIPENGLPDSTIFIWDAHFSANEGQLPLEKIMNNPNFEVVQLFEPLVPFKVLGNNDYRILVFRKITNSFVNNSLMLEKLRNESFGKGVYYIDLYDFEEPFPEEYMEIRRIKSESDSLNFIYNLNDIEFCPAFHVPATKLENAIKSKFRVTVDICRIDSVEQNRLFMVFSAETSKGSSHYVTSDILEQAPVINVWYKTEFVFSLPIEPEKEAVIKSYIWNINKSKVLIDNFKIEIAKQTKNNL